MIAFIKNNTLHMIKKKFLLLYLLNVADIIFTVSLLKTGYFAEVNILMVNAVQSPVASILLKIILPAILLSYMYRELRSAEQDQLRVSNIAINVSLTIYSMVNLSHLVWVAMLPTLINRYG